MSDNKPDLDALLKKWTHLLGVSDWDITVRYCKPSELRCKTDRACVDFNHHGRHASVLLKHSKHFKKSDCAENCNVEASLVHELLHIVLSPFCKDLENGTIAQSVEEQVVNRLSKTLVARNHAKNQAQAN